MTLADYAAESLSMTRLRSVWGAKKPKKGFEPLTPALRKYRNQPPKSTESLGISSILYTSKPVASRCKQMCVFSAENRRHDAKKP
jgi:hypothetical protein